MSDLIKRDDALRSIEEWYAKICKPETIQGLADILAGYSAYKDIAKLPTVDAVEVVRCKDCKWFEKPGCAILIVDDSDKPSKNDFCSFGERREV